MADVTVAQPGLIQGTTDTLGAYLRSLQVKLLQPSLALPLLMGDTLFVLFRVANRHSSLYSVVQMLHI